MVSFLFVANQGTSTLWTLEAKRESLVVLVKTGQGIISNVNTFFLYLLTREGEVGALSHRAT